MAKKEQAGEQAVLELLKRILPKAVPDPKLAEKIFSACELEIQTKARVAAFERFCQRCELPDLEPKTITEVQHQFEATFGKGKVSMVPHPAKQALSVEVVLPDDTFEGVIRVKSGDEEAGEAEDFKPKFVPFPVCLESDPELVWILAKAETLSPPEAAIVLTKVEDEFWGSKTGQKLLRDRVERTFAEFVSRVPGKMLTEAGLKRHYKEPEPLKKLAGAKVVSKKKRDRN